MNNLRMNVRSALRLHQPVQESNTLDFDLLRSIASRTSEDLPVEVVVPAIDQFRETVEGHFATEPSITRGDLIAYQEGL